MKQLILLAALMMTWCSAAAADGRWHETIDGLDVIPAAGPTKVVRLQVYGERIVRVLESPTPKLEVGQSLAVTASPRNHSFTVSQAPGFVVLETSAVHARVNLENGQVSFTDALGRPQLAEYGSAGFTPASIGATPYVAVRQQFNRATDEGLFGLGQHQLGQMNYNGEDVELAQHNMDVAIPFVVSTRNYGLLWDNPSVTRFGNPRPY